VQFFEDPQTRYGISPTEHPAQATDLIHGGMSRFQYPLFPGVALLFPGI